MRFILAAIVLVAVASAIPDSDDEPILSQEMVDLINADGEWEASMNNKFTNMTRGEAKRLLGTWRGVSLDGVEVVDQIDDAIPASFDSRTAWPNGQIHAIRDQAQCGSCWAFAASEALSDRQAIATNNSVNVILSVQDLVSCDTADGNVGCDGGNPLAAWQYMLNTGLPADKCYPYLSGNGISGLCLFKKGTNSCLVTGGAGSAVVYKAASAYAIKAKTPGAMQTDIMTYGPIEVSLDVYEDFFSYTSGVYTHKTGAFAGGHAVKMVGWGTLGGVAYWTCANSWGNWWGINGYFLIKRGTDECGIEEEPCAGHARTS